MKKKYLLYAATPLIGLGLLGAGIASAHGKGGFGFGPMMMPNATPEQVATHQQEMFQQQATLLGVPVDQVKEKWADGKTIQEIATEQGITADQLREKMQTARQAQVKAQLQTLVDKNIITQAQADRRLKAMEQRQQTKPTKGFGRHGGPGGSQF